MADYSLGTAHGQIKIDADTKGVDQAESALGRMNKSAQSSEQAINKTANATGIAGAAIAGGLGLAVKTAMDFDAQLSAIAAVGGKEATARMGEIREAALRIGADTSFSASEAASAMEELVKAGIPVSDVLNGAADATVALAAAGGVDLPTAAGLASNAMNQFNLTADDLVGVTDTIAQTANASAIDVGDLGMAMQQVGAVANLAGLSFDDTAIAIGQLGDAGIKGSDAGTSLKTMLSNLQPTTEKQIGLMEELGLITEDGANKFYDAQGNLKSLRDIQEILNDSTKNLTAQQKQQALETIFGSDAIRAAAVLADGGAKSYDNFAGKMQDVGSAADVAKTRQDNLKGSIEQLKGAAETLAIQVGSALTPIIRTFADALGGVVDWFTKLSPTTQSWIVGILAVGAGLLLMVAGVLKAMMAMRSMIQTMQTLRILSTATQTGFIKMAAVAVWNFAKMAVSAAINAAKTVASWVAAGIKIVAQWVWMGVQAGIQAAKTAAAWLLTAGANAAVAVAQTVAAGARIVAQWVIMGVQAMARAVMMAAAWFIALGPIGWAIAALIAVVAFVVIFWDEIVAFFKAGAEKVAQWMKTAWNWIKSVWNSIVEAFKSAGRAIWNAVLQAVAWLKNTWNSAIAWLRGIPGWIKGIFSSALSWLISAGKNILSGMWNGLKNIWSSVWGWIKNIPNNIKNAFAGAGSWLLNAGKNLLQGLWNGISNAAGWLYDKVIGWAKGLVDSVLGFFGIGSPSKLFEEEIGRWLPPGIAVGIEANASEAIKAAEQLANTVVGAAAMSAGGPDAFWDGTVLGRGYVPPSREVTSYAAAQGDLSSASGPQTVIETHIHNPVAEKASDSEARRLRTLSALGAF